MKKAHKLKKWSYAKTKKERDLVCRELFSHMDDVVVSTVKPNAKIKDVLLQELLSRKPEYVNWKKLICKSFFKCKPVLLSKDELKKAVESKTGYDLESALLYVEAIVRRVIAMRVNPWTQARRFLKSRPGCNKSFALSLREMSFDRKFFEDIVGDEAPNIQPAIHSKKFKKRYARIAKRREVFFEKFPEDFYHSWSSKTGELMFWAIMTQDALRDLRKSAMKLVDNRELFDETYTAKKWPNDVEKMKWSRLIIKAAMLGKDNTWLHSQFAMWLENELALDNINRLEQDWELKFITRPEDFDVRVMREF